MGHITRAAIADVAVQHGQDPLSRARRRNDEFIKVHERVMARVEAQPAAYRDALAAGLEKIEGLSGADAGRVTLAAEKLRYDEQNNVEMVDVLVRAGYKDIPANIDASVIRRLLGYISPV